MRHFFFIAAILSIIISCSKEPTINIREGMDFDPDTLMIDPSMKGWELYSWNSGEVWRYSLMPGTNRVKNANDIYIYEFSVDGREQLKLLLRQLPSDEEVVWFGNEWTTNNVADIRSPFIMPPLLTQYDINEFCELKGIELGFVP